MSKEKVVLAYSGGLDTSVAVKWLQEKYDLNVICLAVDVGQGEDLGPIKEKALRIGATEALVIDAREEFAEEFLFPALKANALYEGKYPLISALSRPLIAKHLVKAAEEFGAPFVAHGCTGKGNDQVRFEISLAALNPALKIIAPIREAKLRRDEALKYAGKHGIPITTGKKSPYSIDENLWGRAVEGEELEDVWNEPSPGVYRWTQDPASSPDEPEYVKIELEKGKPISLNDDEMSFSGIVSKLNAVAGRHGFGRIDMIEDRVVGIKSREIYEAPGALSLITAHRDLEELTLEKNLLRFKREFELSYADLIYSGHWFSPLKKALDAFVDATQEDVSGTIILKLFKGNCCVAKRKSLQALYDYALATYGKDDQFSHQAAKGFIEVWGLPLKIWAQKHRQIQISKGKSDESKKG